MIAWTKSVDKIWRKCYYVLKYEDCRRQVMAKYSLDNVREDSKFLDFIKEEQGYNGFDDIPWYEREALLSRFKAREDDLDDEDFAKLAETENDASLQDISDIYLNGKDVSELSVEEAAFAQTMAAELKKENAPSLNDIISRRSTPMTKLAAENDTQEEMRVSDGAENDTQEEMRVSDGAENDTREEMRISGGAENGGATLENNAPEYDEMRLRSANSDRNEFLIEALQLDVLHDMEIVDDQAYENARQNPQQMMETFHQNENLNEEQRAEFEGRLTDKMAENPQLLAVIPPRFLADRYEHLHEEIARKTEQDKDYDASAEQRKLTLLEGRMDELTDNLAKGEGLFLNDVTNVADTYDGYMKMFEVREKHLSDNEQDAPKKEAITKGRTQLNEVIGEYDREWNLENVSEQDATRLENRSKEISQNLENVELSEESLALVSNFKFLDEQGNAEPQFVGPNGEKSDVWQKGYQIDKESKLADVVRIAKQNVLMENLGSNAELKPEDLSRELNEKLPETLFSLHVADKTVQGALEHPDEFKDKKYLDAFVQDLSNAEKPMTISAPGYEAGVDSMINEVGGYANRLGSKVGKDKAVVVNMFEPLKDLDKRAGQRTEESKPSKKQVRIEMLKRTAKGAALAFLVSGAITIAGAAAASDAGLTAATGGMNKLAGMAIGTGLATVMAVKSIRKWRKAQKAAGKPAGLKAALKDGRLMTTMATTAMGAAALGFAVTGNPGVAQALGYGSMALGMGSGIVTNYQDARKNGLSGLESLGWAALQAGATVAAGMGGRAAGNAGVDWYNEQNPDNNLFQHEEKIGSHKEFDYTETVTDYAALDDNAEKFLENNWYKDHPELLQQRIDALTAAGVENPHHMLLAAHDAGMRAPDNMQMWDGTTSHGNHTVFTQAWAAENNVPYDDVQAVKNLFDANGNVNPQAVEAYKSVAPHIAEDNFVTRMSDRPVIRELYGDRESTYDAEGKIPTKTINHYKEVDDYGMVRNQSDLGVGMVGVFAAPIRGMKKLKERIGSLADRVFKKEKPQEKAPLPPAAPVKEEKRPAPVPHVKAQPSVDKMLMDEYKIVYGVEPNTQEGNNQHWKEYCQRVEEERQAGAKDKSMGDFLIERRKNLDEVLIGDKALVADVDRTQSGKPLKRDYMLHAVKDDRGKAGIVCEARQNLMQSNLSQDNYRNKITLSHFTKFMKHYAVKDEVVADGSRNIALNPKLKEKYGKEGSKAAIVDLNAYLVDGKPLEEAKQKVSGKDARQVMSQLKKQYDREGGR